jgi:multidrug efflux pump subunit AcrA (membrane-fusion protein)
MFTLLFLPMFALLSLFSDGGGGGDTDDETAKREAAEAEKAKAEAERNKVTFDADQQREVQRLVAKEAKVAREKALADAKAEREEQEAAARKEAERKAAEDRGEFDKVRQSIEAERDTFKGKAESAEAELERYRKTFAPSVETGWTDFPDELKDAYDGADDDTLAKAAFMAKWEKTAERLRAQGATERGNPPNPNRVGRGEVEITSPITRREITG